jgi:acyl carrier protein
MGISSKEDISMVFDKIKDALVNQLELDPDKISGDTLIIEDLGADSLDIMELMMAMEEEFNITIPDEGIQDVKTVNDAVEFIESLI